VEIHSRRSQLVRVCVLFLLVWRRVIVQRLIAEEFRMGILFR
jgi:hypothetical protein